MTRSSRNNASSDPDAHKFDQFLKKLETTKQPPSPMNEQSRPAHADSFDNSTFDSRNESAFCDPITSSDRQNTFDRQCFVDRSDGSPIWQPDSVDSFIQRSSFDMHNGDKEPYQQVDRNNARIFEEGLPDAILKLDRRHAIPTPKHKNDVLVEIEASTVDRRDLMVRPGVRCTESLPQGVETTGMDCIGRVVQLTTHARAVYGISIDDRVAAIYPFEYKDGSRNRRSSTNNRYALVDAGFVVTVPKHVDAAEAACMIRLYLSAFQSISKGVSSLYNRYGFNQLEGQSILIQNGQTELGRALIDLAVLLGASQIFATGPTECHPLLMELGAVPLGAETFSWELFLEEKLSLVLVQEMPTADNFEQFISILDENKGDMVYIHHGHKHVDDDDLGIMADDVSCDGLQFQDLKRKFQSAVNSLKFSVRLACSPKYIVYEGVWPSCKENPNQFKEDLRYLFTLLGQGNLKPHVSECINSEEVTEVQDRIELLGKRGTVVCLPTALYEKKVCNVVSPPDSPLKRDQKYLPVLESDVHDFIDNDYASDAGYVTHPSDTLSDFHRMRDTRKHTRAINDNVPLPAPPEAKCYSKSYSSSNFNHSPTSVAHHSAPLFDAMSDNRRSTEGREYCHNDASLAISSVGLSSATNASSGQIALGSGTLNTKLSFQKEDPPLSIQFRSNHSRRARAYQRRKRGKGHSKNVDKKEKKGDLESCPSQEKSVATSPTYSARTLRRNARRREQTCAEAAANVVETKSVTGNIDANKTFAINGMSTESETQNFTRRSHEIHQTLYASHSLHAPVQPGSCELQDSRDEDENIDAKKTNALNAMSTECETQNLTRRSHEIHQTLSGSHPLHAPAQHGSCELQDSRQEDECARDNSSNGSSFSTLMNKWKNIDDSSHQSDIR